MKGDHDKLDLLEKLVGISKHKILRQLNAPKEKTLLPYYCSNCEEIERDERMYRASGHRCDV